MICAYLYVSYSSIISYFFKNKILHLYFHWFYFQEPSRFSQWRTKKYLILSVAGKGKVAFEIYLERSP